jgi:maltooligosyltrehalose trehalohydrolase
MVMADDRWPLGPDIGAVPDGHGGWRFRVWAPAAAAPVVVLDHHPDTVPLTAEPGGYWSGAVDGVPPGTRYGFRLQPGGSVRADPASRRQPDGVLGWSALWTDDGQWTWTDHDFRGVDPNDPGFVLYEMHVGSFTREGTFDSAIPHLSELRRLGATAVELLPVAQSPGRWNWGYDGVFIYAVHEALGGPAGLGRFVDAAHAVGLSVVMDVVYNHLGPEGGHFDEFGPYFSARHHTPWGPALNFDGPGSDAVRRFFLGHAVEWQRRFHLDGFRFDAVHAIVDQTALPFWEQVTTTLHRARGVGGGRLWLAAESDWNAPRVVKAPEAGGLGFDAFWSDDVHHAVHAAMTGERAGYYQDFGSLADVAAAVSQGVVQTGRWSGYRGRHHGRPAAALDPASVVVYLQNHDQVGNRPAGDRIDRVVDPLAARAAAGLMLLTPFVPMLFMGEEYGEPAPFLYFVDHAGADLRDKVRRGRAEEAVQFGWTGAGPDPTHPDAFYASKLTRHERVGQRRYYETLIRWRTAEPALAARPPGVLAAVVGGGAALSVERWGGGQRLLLLWVPSASDAPATLAVPAAGIPSDGARAGVWKLRLDAWDREYGGPGRALPAAVGPGSPLFVPGPSFSVWELALE